MKQHEYKDHEIIQDVIQSRFRGNVEFYTKMIELFFDTLNGYLDQIEEGFAHTDSEKVKSAAHSIKGSAANLGASSLQSISQKLEHQSDNLNGSGEALDLFEQLKAELNSLKEYSVTYLQ